MKTIVAFLMLGAAVPAVQMTAGQAQLTAQVAPDSEIRRILADRVDKYRQSVGIVVGIIEQHGRRIVSYGGLDQADSRSLGGDTIFEIGSVTKVFTSLLLADMAQRGDVALTDPVAKYLPASANLPVRAGRQITLEDLATHTSGLPREPPNFNSLNPANSEGSYSVDQLYRFLSTYELKHNVGSHFEYSNLGAGLLAIGLTQHSGMNYEALVATRIAKPLGMASTGISLTPEMRQRLAAGHGYALNPAPSVNLGIFAGAGALRSTANDMLTFLAADLGYAQTPLAQAMAAMMKGDRPRGGGAEVHLAWLSSNDKGRLIVWHNGKSLGYSSFLGYSPETRVGVVVLSNCGSGPGVDDVGMHILNPRLTLLSGDALKTGPRASGNSY
jgi:D-alanyl-D-alanine-carboxypeptidase/D-alanyl-D-alanine-endopeptidase